MGRESATEFHNETSKSWFILIMGTFEASDILSACTYQRFAFEHGGVTVELWPCAPRQRDRMGHLGF